MAAYHQKEAGAIAFEDEENDDLDEMEKELMAATGEDSNLAPKLIKVRVFINMDEDDEDDESKGVDLGTLFLREDEDLPFYTDVSHITF